ncbi:MAG: AAA family ATPase, partial [bacterium]
LEAKQRPVLIIDEAQHLRNEVLEDLRLLTNYEMDSQNRLCLLLVGLTELRRRPSPWRCTNPSPNASSCAITSDPLSARNYPTTSPIAYA